MEKVVNVIEGGLSEELNAVIDSKTHTEEEKQIVRHAWQRDVQRRKALDARDFHNDQKKNSLGSKRNRWSAITFRVALAVYSRSPSAYKALCKFDNILCLPGVETVKGKMRQYVHQPGINHEYMLAQRERYMCFCSEKVKQGAKKPIGEGALVFDEVKIIDKLVWNSRSETFVGVAMSKDDCCEIRDIFAKADTDSQPLATQYIVQFLWRDLSADFDVIGPYYSSSKHITQQFLMGCLMDTMRIFTAYGFCVTCLVCDGAATNLSLIKTTLGLRGKH
jgi:hypothetical protein